MARDAMTRSISQGIEYAAALPEYLLDASSTLRELFGVVEVVLSLAPSCGGAGTRLSWTNAMYLHHGGRGASLR